MHARAAEKRRLDGDRERAAKAAADKKAEALAASERNARRFTDTSSFALQCLVCGAGLKGNADAEAHASDDAAALDKARARNDLEGACYGARSTLSKHASDLDVSAAQSEVDEVREGPNLFALAKKMDALAAAQSPKMAATGAPALDEVKEAPSSAS